MRDNLIEEMRKDYDNIEIPEQLKTKVESGIKQAIADSIRYEKSEAQSLNWRKTDFALLAALVVFVILIIVMMISNI